jgi:hypothetical protein
MWGLQGIRCGRPCIKRFPFIPLVLSHPFLLLLLRLRVKHSACSDFDCVHSFNELFWSRFISAELSRCRTKNQPFIGWGSYERLYRVPATTSVIVQVGTYCRRFTWRLTGLAGAWPLWRRHPLGLEAARISCWLKSRSRHAHLILR